MPLDPFFAERLRVHRRYLIGQALAGVRAPDRAALAVRARRAPRPPAAATTAPAPRTRRRQLALARARAASPRRARVGPQGAARPSAPRAPTSARPSTTSPPTAFPRSGCAIYHPACRRRARCPRCLAFFGGAFRIGGIDYPTTDAAFRRRAADVRRRDRRRRLRARTRAPLSDAGRAGVTRRSCGCSSSAASSASMPDRIGVAGISAGGEHRGRASRCMNRDRTRLPLRLQVLEVPVTDLTGRHLDFGATRALGIPTLIALRELRSVARTYLPRRVRCDARRTPPRCAPRPTPVCRRR